MTEAQLKKRALFILYLFIYLKSSYLLQIRFPVKVTKTLHISCTWKLHRVQTFSFK